VVRKSKLTRCAFNSTQPLLLVGDDRGQVLCLKVRACSRACLDFVVAPSTPLSLTTTTIPPRLFPPNHDRR
jgi:hypothetical protein